MGVSQSCHLGTRTFISREKAPELPEGIAGSWQASANARRRGGSWRTGLTPSVPLMGLNGKESFQPAASWCQQMLVASERSVVTRPFTKLPAGVMMYRVHQPRLMLEGSQKWR